MVISYILTCKWCESCSFKYLTMCAVFVRQKTQEMYQSSIYLSIKYRAQKQLLMNSKEGENLCRLSDTLWFVFLFSLLSPLPFLSFLPQLSTGLCVPGCMPRTGNIVVSRNRWLLNNSPPNIIIIIMCSQESIHHKSA